MSGWTRLVNSKDCRGGVTARGGQYASFVRDLVPIRMSSTSDPCQQKAQAQQRHYAFRMSLSVHGARFAMQGVATPAFQPCAPVDGSHAWPCHVVAVLVAVLWACIVAVLTWRVLTHRRTGVYMLDFACFAPPCECAMRS